ncbi:hypothetical protein D3H65_18835 [Paraflavitalea soli]|uniref:Uncharacterized protein n=1 Tax=Paraflavitalea soli TaxID=2315862 RepID=A0A3B7MS97_9BACT|nr:hypothetical protein D3H65_18835 [Paraflavitalea soli]
MAGVVYTSVIELGHWLTLIYIMLYMGLYGSDGPLPDRYSINFAEFLLFSGRGMGYPHQVHK